MSKPIIPSLLDDCFSRQTIVPEFVAIDSGKFLGVSHRARHFTLRVALGERLATVLLLLSSGEGYFDLRAAVLEVELEWDEREGLCLCLSVKILDLVAMHQQLAFAIWIVTSETDGECPRRYVHLEEPEFAVVNAGVGVGDLCIPLAQ